MSQAGLLETLDEQVPTIHRSSREADAPGEPPRRQLTEPAVDDAELVRRAQAGERFAEDAIYRRHAPMITRVCARTLQRTSDADDAVQDTFVKAFRALGSLRDGASLRPWLARIALHVCRRRLKRRALLRLCGLGNTPEDGLALREAHLGVRPDLKLELEAIEAALQREPAELRAVWLLHRVEGLSIQDTADAAGKSAATVKRYVAAVDARVSRAHGGSHGE